MKVRFTVQANKIYYRSQKRGYQNPNILPYTSGKKDLSILKIESAHTKDTPRGSTAMMSLEDSERTKSGQYAERNRQEQ